MRRSLAALSSPHRSCTECQRPPECVRGDSPTGRDEWVMCSYLGHRGLGAVYQLAKGGEKLRPVHELASHGDRGDEGAGRGTDEGGALCDRAHCRALHESLDLIWEASIM